MPTSESPPTTPFTFHVTAVFVAFATVALNCCVAPRSTVAVPGETYTVTRGGGGGGGGGFGPGLEPPPPPPQPVTTSRNAQRRYVTEAGMKIFRGRTKGDRNRSVRSSEMRGAHAMTCE